MKPLRFPGAQEMLGLSESGQVHSGSVPPPKSFDFPHLESKVQFFSSSTYCCTDLFPAKNPDQITRLIDIENQNGQTILPSHGHSCYIHHLEII